MENGNYESWKGQKEEMTPDSLDRVIELINLLHEEVSALTRASTMVARKLVSVLMTRMHP